MTNIYKYYIELKNRVFLLLLAWIATLLVSYIYKETLLFLIIRPSLNYTNVETVYFIFTDVTEIFAVYFKIIMFLGNHIIIGFSLYHLILFFYLGLYNTEYKKLSFTIKIVITFFLISILFFNKILLPTSWHFFLSFQSFSLLKSINLYFESKLNEYLTFYITSYYVCVCYCQIFVLLIFFLEHIKTQVNKIKQSRKILYYSFIIVSTLITPPDVISQLVLSLSLILIYETVLWSLVCQLSLQKLKNQPILKQ
uniref:SecY-independent transporter protein n=1 Tax=Haslea pseudostrearia TaxID=197756 RepID=UPI0021FE2786|nr:SecY-independent transporter protein [Haslea pseudostrearia]UXN44195.1 SecY-independent transporter protein [Haslea pseudostrearia]